MKKTFAIILGMSVLAACHFAKTKPVFSITTPAGWERQDTVARLGDTVINFSPGANSTDSAYDRVALLIVYPLRPETYEQTTVQKLKDDAVFCEQKEKGSVLVDGAEGNWVHLLIQYKTNDTKLEQRLYFIPKNGFVYMFICTTLEGGYEQIKPKVDGLINSLKFTAP